MSSVSPSLIPKSTRDLLYGIRRPSKIMRCRCSGMPVLCESATCRAEKSFEHGSSSSACASLRSQHLRCKRIQTQSNRCNERAANRFDDDECIPPRLYLRSHVMGGWRTMRSSTVFCGATATGRVLPAHSCTHDGSGLAKEARIHAASAESSQAECMHSLRGVPARIRLEFRMHDPDHGLHGSEA